VGQVKIGLIDVDGHNFPNLALMKISAYHKAIGDDVEMWFPFNRYDRVYKSKVFTFTPDIQTVIQADEVKQGGTGYDLENKLPDYIEKQCPDYSIYPQYSESYGFLTRGCPRNCPFCIVSKKEGRKSYQVADLKDFHRGQKTIKLLDPNIIACNNADVLIKQLIDSKAYVDFTGGIDARLLDSSNAQLLGKVKVKMIHFAWDLMKFENEVIRGLNEYKKATNIDMRKTGVYVLTNFSTSHEEDLYRVEKIKELGYMPYVMIYERDTAPKITKQLARYVNNRTIFFKIDSFKDYLKRGVSIDAST
jgi:hypothetical protein